MDKLATTVDGLGVDFDGQPFASVEMTLSGNASIFTNGAGGTLTKENIVGPIRLYTKDNGSSRMLIASWRRQNGEYFSSEVVKGVSLQDASYKYFYDKDLVGDLGSRRMAQDFQ